MVAVAWPGVGEAAAEWSLAGRYGASYLPAGTVQFTGTSKHLAVCLCGCMHGRGGKAEQMGNNEQKIPASFRSWLESMK